jgi:hypothetical protein
MPGMDHTSANAERFRLGKSSQPEGARSMAALIGGYFTLVLGGLGIWGGSRVIIVMALICAGITAVAWWGQRSLSPVAAAPAVLFARGFRLQLDDDPVIVPWADVTDVQIWEQEYAISMVAFLDSDSGFRGNQVVERYRQMSPPDRLGNTPVWLGDVTTADEPMDVILTAVRGWVGERLDTNPVDHRGRRV